LLVMINTKAFVNRDSISDDQIIYQSEWMNVHLLRDEFWVEVTWRQPNIDLSAEELECEKLTYVLATKGYATVQLNWVLVDATSLANIHDFDPKRMGNFFADFCEIKGVKKYAIVVPESWSAGIYNNGVVKEKIVHTFTDDTAARIWLRQP
jgi:hypothetical protein